MKRMEITELTKDQKLSIMIDVLAGLNSRRDRFICNAIYFVALEKELLSEDTIRLIFGDVISTTDLAKALIPEFAKYEPERLRITLSQSIQSGPWWKVGDYNTRIGVVNKIIKEIQEDK